MSGRENDAGDASLVLTPPAPVAPVEPERAARAITLDATKDAELRQRASSFAARIAATDVGSSAFADVVASISSMGERDLQESTRTSRRMLERPAARARGNEGDAQTRVGRTLTRLRDAITDLDPGRAQLSGARRALSRLVGGDRNERYFAKYQAAQAQLDTIIRDLDAGQDELRKDNAAIDTEKARLAATMARLTEYAALAGALDAELEQVASRLDAAGRRDSADVVRSQALFAARQRRQDVLTHLAVCVQGHLALEMVQQNNLELIKGVARAMHTTLAALRTAVLVSQALSQQQLVLDRLGGLDAAAARLAQATPQGSGPVGADTEAELRRLRSAFEDVFATMDAVDAFRGQAQASMSQTVTALEGRVGGDPAALR